MNKEISIKYCFLQGMYWMLAAVAMAYMTPLLEAKGFTGIEIGYLSAVKYLSVIVFQMIIGSFADRHLKTIPVKNIIIGLSVLGIIFAALFWNTGHNMVMAIMSLIVFGATINCASPLVDSLSIQYMNHGVRLNYTVSRACGSICWAVFCVIVGIISDKLGTNNILLFQMLAATLFAIAAFIMNPIDYTKEPIKDISEKKEKSKSKKVHSNWYLIANFPKYTLFLVGLVLLFASYNMNTTFLVNVFENLGGNHFHYGMAQFVLSMAEVPVALVFYKIKNKISIDKLMLICSIFSLLRATATTLAPNVPLLIMAQAFEIGGFSIFYAGSVFYVTDYLPINDSVKGTSLINLAGMGLGDMIGSIMCGIIKDKWGMNTLMTDSLFVGILAVLVMFVMTKVPARKEYIFNIK